MSAKKKQLKNDAPVQETAATTDIVALEDLLKLQITLKEAENAQLRRQLAEADLEKYTRLVDTSSAQLKRIVAQANEKYQLRPSLDTLDVATGKITRGSKE
jgi:hypothetical protein